VQEQINNIIKHSHAKNATIQLALRSGHILLIVKDDGIGFDSSKTSGGIGLRNISHRVGLYDGVIKIISAPGKGCTLEITIPLK
jgi:signal transduction histidine kinase